MLRNRGRRPSARLLVHRAAVVARGSFAMYGLLVFAWTASDGLWHVFIAAFALYFSYTRLMQVVHDYATISYHSSARQISIRRGFISETTLRFDWRHVVAVSMSATWMQRLLGVADVTVTTAASSSAAVVLPGLLKREAQRLRRLHGRSSRHVPAPADRLTMAEESREGRRLTALLRLRDYVLIGINTGLLFMLVPAVSALVNELAVVLPVVAPHLPTLEQLRTLGWLQLTIIATGVLITSVIYGAVVAWLRYRRFDVHLLPDGGFRFRAGFLRQEERVLLHRGVEAFEVRMPLHFQISAVASIRVVSRGESGQTTRGTLLPVISVEPGLTLLREVTGVSVKIPASGFVSRAFASTALLSGVTGSLLVTLTNWVWLIPIALFAVVVAAGARQFGRSHLLRSPDGSQWLVLERGILSRSLWLIRAADADVIRWRGFHEAGGVQSVSVRDRLSRSISVWPIPYSRFDTNTAQLSTAQAGKKEGPDHE